MIQKFFRGQRVRIVNGDLNGMSAIVLWSQSDIWFDEGSYNEEGSALLDVLIVDCEQPGYERSIPEGDLELVSDDRSEGENTLQEYKEAVQSKINGEIDAVEATARKDHPKLFMVSE
jgi:hypothetical protein